MYQFRRSLVSVCLLGLACESSKVSQPREPIDRSQVHVVLGTMSGQLLGSGVSFRDARIATYGYFEGDSIARVVAASASSDGSGTYRLAVSDSAQRQGDASATDRRWRAFLVIEPLAGAGAALSVALTDWVIVKSGEPSTLAISMDITLSAKGSLPQRLPVAIPNPLPTRQQPPDISSSTDSLIRAGVDVFVRTTALANGPALALLADAGLTLGQSHTAFHVFLGSGPFTVWGRVAANSQDAVGTLTRIASLPFVVAVEPLRTLAPSSSAPALPYRDSETMAPGDERRLVYDRNNWCHTDIPSTEGVASVSCGTLIVGLIAGIRGSDVAGLLSSLGATVAADHSEPPNGTGRLLVRVPLRSERPVRAQLVADSRIRYAELEQVGFLSSISPR